MTVIDACRPSAQCGQCDHCAEATSWEPVDLAAALAGERPPPPSIWHHSRGHALLYPGRTHVFAGDSETLKSWAAQMAITEVLTAGGDVLYVDYEDDEYGVVDRLRALGVINDEVIDTRLRYVRPDEPVMDRQGRYTPGGLRFHELLAERPWVLAILDGVTEAMTTEGLEINDNADAARFNRRILRPMAATGAATVSIDHVVKNGEGGRHALGAGHKLGGLTGAQFMFKTQRPLRRALGSEPETGIVSVTVAKDRPGWVRGRGDEVGLFRVTAWPDGGVDAELIDPGDLGDAGADMELAGEILDHLGTYEGCSANQIEKDINARAARIRATLKWMVGKGWVEVRKEGQAHRHYLTPDGRNEGRK